MWTRKAGFGLGMIGAALAATPAAAQSVEEFYASKPLRVVIGYSPGGGYDLYARLLSRFIGRYLPGRMQVLEGEPDHRDMVLSDEEKARNDSIMICCSGSKSPRLVLASP